jgi:hypothetical protein
VPGAGVWFACFLGHLNSAHFDHNCSIVPQYQNSMDCCSFEVAAVQSKETKSWGAESVTAGFEIPALPLASFAVDPDRR